MMPERARESLARKPESSGVADELSAAPPTRESRRAAASDERVSSGGSTSSLVRHVTQLFKVLQYTH